MKLSPRWRTLVVLSLASAGWAFSFGLALPLGSLWLTDAGLSNQEVGLSTSVYYLGVAGASLLLPWLMRRGSRRLVIAGLLIDAAATACFPWITNWMGWFLLRLVSGVATAICLIPMETRINHNAPPDRRARDFSIYAVSVALGIGLGDVVGLLLYPTMPYLAFGLGGLTALLAGVLLFVAYPGELPIPEEEGQAPLHWRGHVLSLGTAWFQGVLEGGVLTFMTSYLLGLQFNEAATSGLLSSLFLGVVLFQLPGAWLADRFGRLRVLLCCHAVVLASLLCLPFCTNMGGLVVLLFAVGAACAFLYPLGLALLGERVGPHQMGTANSWYLAINCLGSLTGPWLMGKAIDVWGPRAMFAVGIAGSAIVFAAWGLLQKNDTAALAPPAKDSGTRAA